MKKLFSLVTLLLAFTPAFAQGIDEKINEVFGNYTGWFVELIFKEVPIENKKYAWEREDYNPEEDEFLKQFDENGNFIEKPKVILESESQNSIKIVYTIKKEPNGETESL